MLGLGCWTLGDRCWGPVDEAAGIATIRRAVERGINWFDTAPIYGDGQSDRLLAKALGGRVARAPRREIGWYDVERTRAGADDPVLSTFAQRQRVFQWHEDNIELPAGIDALAGSADCPVQAFRHGEHAYGFQFHLEVDRFLIERWLTVPANQPVLEAERGRIDPDFIRERTMSEIDALQAQSAICLLYTSPSPRDATLSRMPSSA